MPHAHADTACLDVPKVALVSTLASMSPAMPFIFRNYEIPPASEALARQVRGGRRAAGAPPLLLCVGAVQCAWVQCRHSLS